MSLTAAERRDARFFYKSRALWRPDAYRLLREDTCIRFARHAVAPMVDGFRIVFPDTEVSVSLRVNVASRRIPGRPLMDLLYQPDKHDLALQAGLAVLKALHGAGVAGHPFPVFSQVYRFAKGPRVLLQEHLGRSPILSGPESHELSRLVRQYVAVPGPWRVLVHGDLQPSHLIVDSDTSTIGVIDLEALHVGKPAPNFGQLFTGYHYADPALGRGLYACYRQCFPELFDRQFDDDLRTTVALRSYRHAQIARRSGNAELAFQARRLLAGVLAAPSFAGFCREGYAR